MVFGQKSVHPKAKQAKKPHFPAPFRGKRSLLPRQSAIYNCNTKYLEEDSFAQLVLEPAYFRRLHVRMRTKFLPPT
jgi:hypothetical protein